MADDARREAFRGRLEALRRDFVNGLPSRLEALRDAVRAGLAGPGPGASPWAELQGEAHRLAGSGATFGLPEVSARAAELERGLADLGASAPPWPERLVRTLREAADGLVASLPASTVPGPSLAPLPPDLSRLLPPEGRPLVAVVGGDRASAEAMKTQLGLLGFEARLHGSMTAFRSASSAAPPEAVLLDVDLPGGTEGGLGTLARIEPKAGEGPPVVFLSARGDIESRLAAVRTGARAYFAKPVDFGRLAEVLDALVGRSQMRPFRVILLDDEPAVANYHGLALANAGMTFRVLGDHAGLRAAAVEFEPDVLVMELHLGSVEGRDLAAALRQDPAFAGIPIVFLSRETEVKVQRDALLHGDDFVPKSPDTEWFVSLVKSRAMRSRQLRPTLPRDGLTGLVSHSSLRARLAVEMARARRHDEPLAFALLDVDGFRALNERHGHAAGDQVLRVLARLLDRRLRSEDEAGRFGGDEFGAILSGAPVASAAKVLDALRIQFSRVEHRDANGLSFLVTFSAAVTDARRGDSPPEVIRRAAAALARARREGPDRLVTDEPPLPAPS